MKVDMSEEAVTRRMVELDQLWEMAVALRSSDLEHSERVENPDENVASIGRSQKPPKTFDLSAK